MHLDIQEIEELNRITMGELSLYLESWGFAVSSSESYAELLEAARLNFETEGPGLGPFAED